jgi:hypothetical protein
VQRSDKTKKAKDQLFFAVCFRQKQKFVEGLRSRDFDQKMPGLFGHFDTPEPGAEFRNLFETRSNTAKFRFSI